MYCLDGALGVGTSARLRRRGKLAETGQGAMSTRGTGLAGASRAQTVAEQRGEHKWALVGVGCDGWGGVLRAGMGCGGLSTGRHGLLRQQRGGAGRASMLEGRAVPTGPRSRAGPATSSGTAQTEASEMVKRRVVPRRQKSEQTTAPNMLILPLAPSSPSPRMGRAPWLMSPNHPLPLTASPPPQGWPWAM